MYTHACVYIYIYIYALLFSVKDYMSDGAFADGRSPLSPISVTSGYKSDASCDSRLSLLLYLLTFLSLTTSDFLPFSL